MLETLYAYVSRVKFSLYFLLAYEQNQKLKNVGGCDCFEDYQCFEMHLGIRTMRSSNHRNGLNVDTLNRECPGILKSTADRGQDFLTGSYFIMHTPFVLKEQ